MCGIAGIIGRRDEPLARRMTDALAHRGPDDAGIHAADGVTLGHRRLSIIDLGGGHQPMANAGETLWLVYNGEIYNYRDLRKDLEAKGHIFRTDSDTEIILEAYAEWGEPCVERFQGMFAFALWDAPKKTLLLARDQIGVKPLYYTRAGNVLYFASEMKALLEIPGISREMDLEALDDYLAFLHTVPPRTFYQAIRQLPPAHTALWRDGEWRERRYWRLQRRDDTRTPEEWRDAVRATLRDTIRAYLVADVPLGAFLSGGLDSTTILHFMNDAGAAPVNTFTVGFGKEGGHYDESTQAAVTAAHYHANHHPLEAGADAAALLDTMLHHFDEPFGNPTALLTYAICELVKKHVTVVLSGDGGDEMFGGYARHAGAALAAQFQRIPTPIRRWGLNPLIQCLPESTRGFHLPRRLREFSAGSLMDPVDMYALWISYYQQADKALLYTNPVQRALDGRDALDRIRALAKESGTTDPAARAMYIDMHSFLPDNVLHYGDRMSMAHGLEVRVPLADPRLAELLAGAPGNMHVHGAKTKCLFRDAMTGLLPPGVTQRKKIGFNPPMGVWLNTTLRPLVDDCLSPETVRKRGLFHPEPIAAMLEAHRAGRRDYTWHLWALVVLEAWQRR